MERYTWMSQYCFSGLFKYKFYMKIWICFSWHNVDTDPDCGFRVIMDENETFTRDHLAFLSRGGKASTLAPMSFYCLTGHITRSSLTMHRFALDGYLIQKTKEPMLLITSRKRDICK